MRYWKRPNALIRILSVVLPALLYAGPGMAQTVTIELVFPPPPPSLSEGASPSEGAGTATIDSMHHEIFPPTLPAEMKEEEARAVPEGEPDPVLRDELNQLGPVLTFERFSNDALGRDGNVYGLSGSYERKMDPTPVKLGAVLDWRFFDLDNKYGEDFDAIRLAGVVYGGYGLLKKPVEVWAGGIGHLSYTMNTKGVEDYAAFGAGVYVSVRRSLKFVDLSVGATYLYTKYDIGLQDDHSHLVKYGLGVGVPIGRKLSANLHFTETRNATDYVQAVIDKNYFTLGVEGIYSITRTWVVSGGYRTILAYEDFSSHMGYLGTLVKF